MNNAKCIQQVDAIIDKVLRSSYQRFTELVNNDELHYLCETTINVLREQSTLVEMPAPVVICGDLQGQFTDLVRIFDTLGAPPKKNYLFLGNYVNRGKQGMEIAVLLFCYKIKYADNFVLLRGSSECSKTNRSGGFLDEITRRYGQENAQLLWDHFNQTFSWLPYVGLVGKKILCVHSGLSPTMYDLQQLGSLRRPALDPANPSLELDILFADPEPGTNGFRANKRGQSVMFGENVVTNLSKQFSVNVIVRGHQVVREGVDYFADRRLVTVFSVPHLSTSQNAAFPGAVLIIGEDLHQSTKVFPPR
uniref:protein-serine/threonine phosphatase n=1 Tax=Globodera rostochiensis TaxID=31243 RepID=A0A914IDG0_GLORO